VNQGWHDLAASLEARLHGMRLFACDLTGEAKVLRRL